MNMTPTLSRSLEQIKNGKMVILVDDESRENEGDLILSSEFVNAETINFMAKHARGLICLTLNAKRVDELGLQPMSSRNDTPRKTAFTVSIEAKEGVTTGISAADRAHTIRVASDLQKGAKDITTPGHIFPLRACDGGVLERPGHTEGSIDLMKLSGLKPSAVICEIMNDDGTMARMPDLRKFAETHGLPILSIKDLIAYRLQSEELLENIATSKLPTEFGNFTVQAYRSKLDQSEHLALIKGTPSEAMTVRVHSECLTGDALLSLRCDCGAQLKESMKFIQSEENGMIIYLRNHEGRGIGLGNKIRAYALQDQGADTVSANHELGFKADMREYTVAAQILNHLKIKNIKLLTNNPEKINGLESLGIKVLQRIPLETTHNPHNTRYLFTKKNRLGHTLQDTQNQ